MELDLPYIYQTIGSTFSQASRGLKLYRRIDSISDEFKRKEAEKFREYLEGLKPGAMGFYYIPETEQDRIIEENKRIVGEMFSANNREATIYRHARKNKVGIADLRKISDGEVRTIRAGLNSDLLKVFDRHLSLPEEQLLETALVTGSV